MALNPLDKTVLGFSESRNPASASLLLGFLETFDLTKTPNSSYRKLKDLLPVGVNALLRVNNNYMSDLSNTT
jgi:hypothetical protein